MNQTTSTTEAINAAFRKFSASISPQLKQQMNGRLERGLQIVLTGGVVKYNDLLGSGFQRRYQVNSSNPANPPYLVDLNSRTCTCPDHWKGHYCKHRIAAQVFELAGSRPADGKPAGGKQAGYQKKCAQPQPKTIPQTSVSKPNLEERIDQNSIVWACLRLNGKLVGVEVLGIEGEQVRVQALPVVSGDGKLEPQFPFPDGKCYRSVQPSELFHIRIYRNE